VNTHAHAKKGLGAVPVYICSHKGVPNVISSLSAPTSGNARASATWYIGEGARSNHAALHLSGDLVLVGSGLGNLRRRRLAERG